MILQRLQIEQYGSCIAMPEDVGDTLEDLLKIYNFSVSVILLGVTFVTSLIKSPSTFHREVVHSLWAVTVALIPVPTLYIYFNFLIYHEWSDSEKVKNLELITWIPLLENVCAAMLIMLILFGPSVSS